ncbi:hypothetical protein MMC11_005924 [Xylographa trunciseda]|nr:hypothetical protein [Xylographa trunciseda]
MSTPSDPLGASKYQKKKLWESNHGSQPSPILEDEEILEDTQEFTTVVHRNSTARSRQGSTAPIKSWRTSTVQRSGTVKNTLGTPYPPTGLRNHSTLAGAIEKSYKQAVYPARQGEKASPYPTSTLGRMSLYAPQSHAATARSSHYNKINNTSTVAYHQDRGRHVTTKKNKAADRAEYKVGMIFYAMLHQEHWAGDDAPVEEAVTRSNNGVIHSKKRPFVVVSLYDSHYVSLPLFTHSGQGIGNRVSDEYVSVYDPRSHLPKVQQSQHPVLFAGNMLPNTYPLKPTSTIRLTYPVAREYSAESWREGYLDNESTAKLIKLYRHATKAFAAPSPAILMAAAKVKAQKETVEKARKAADAAQALVVTADLPGLAPIERVMPLRHALATRIEVSTAQDGLAKALEESLNLHT